MIEHGVSFGELHSFWDLDLILSSAEIPPASPKESYIEIPGADGSLDMTEAHGEVKYDDRTGAKFIFFMNPAGDLSESAWEAKKKEVSNRLNGWRGNITLDKDPDYFWQGRCKVDEFASNKRLRKIVVGARLAPYKLKKELTRVVAELRSANLLRSSAKSATSAGVTFTVNEDKSITIQTGSGGATGTATLVYLGAYPGATNGELVSESGMIIGRTYTVSMGDFISGVSLVFYVYNENGDIAYSCEASSDIRRSFTLPEGSNRLYGYIKVTAGTVLTSPFTIYPMIVAGTEVPPYVPYGKGLATVALPNSRKTVCPTITCENETTLTVDGAEYVVSEGTHKVLDLQLHEGETEVTVTGTGEVIFEYQEGDL